MRLSILKWPVVFILLLSAAASAQSNHAAYRHSLPTAKVTVVDPNEDNYDIHYVKLDLTLTNSSTTFSGIATTTATVVAPSMPAYYFELDTAYTIDSCLVNGILYPVATTDSSLRKVQLPSALTAGANFTARVVYHGTGVRGFFSAFASGTNITFSQSQPYGSSGWWPCKQSLRDKIDSTDVWLTVPDTLKTGSNGVLQHITPLPGNLSRHEWHNNKAIDYYLVSVVAGDYLDHTYYMHFAGTTDSMLIQNYYCKNEPNLSASLACMDSIAGMINYYSSLFGRYPFWQQKYGNCEAPGPNGTSTENQSMTTIHSYDLWLAAHELGHQWFGDNLTCGTWKDIWLNEGFASYLAYLYEENVEDPAIAKADMDSKHGEVTAAVNDSSVTYLPDTVNLFGGGYFNNQAEQKNIYDRGPSMLHMLRFQGNDSLFFTAMKQYYQQFAGGNAVTADLQAVFEQVYNQSLDTFFNQWIYGAGHPMIRTSWNQSGNQVFFQLKQTSSAPLSVPVFTTPIEVRLKSAQGDTTVRVYFNQAIQQYEVTFANPVSSVETDPNGWLLAKIYFPVKDTTLAITIPQATPAIVYPNPTTNTWTITYIPTHTTLTLVDANGKKIWQGITTNNTQTTIPAKQLPAAIYYLHLQPAQGTAQSIKLIKQ